MAKKIIINVKDYINECISAHNNIKESFPELEIQPENQMIHEIRNLMSKYLKENPDNENVIFVVGQLNDITVDIEIAISQLRLKEE